MTSRTFRPAAALGILSLFWLLPHAPAQVVTYTDHAAFVAALSSGYNPAQVTNFDSVAPGVVATGGTVEGTTFAYSLGLDGFGNPINLQVGDTFPTTSPTQYLGTTADDAFLSGDAFTMTFATPQHAVGLFIISAGVNLAGDYTLTVPQGSALSSGVLDPAFAYLAAPAFGSNYVYFVGLAESNPANSFTSVSFSSVGGLGIPFDVDDITRASRSASPAVPETTSTAGLLLAGLLGLLVVRRRRR